MPIVAPSAITVTTTTALVLESLNGAASAPQSIVLSAPSTNTNAVLVGPSGSENFPIASGVSLTIDMYAGDAIYAVVASGTETLNVLYNRA